MKARNRLGLGRWVAGLLVLCALAGCQLLPASANLALPRTQSVVEARQGQTLATNATNQIELWGQVPTQCLCHGEPLVRIANDIRDSKLPITFNLQPAVEGWQRFSVTFDPTQVPQPRVEQLLTAAGATIIPSPH